MTKTEALFKQFQNAVDRLDDVMKKEKDEYIRDSAIQRFEFTFDLSWKLIKAFLEDKKGLICSSPKECFKEAYRQKIIEYDNFWMLMTDKRNKTTHLYNEKMADEVYDILSKSLTYFKILLNNLVD